MKKILTSLALLGILASGAYAQKNIDLQMVPLTPTSGFELPNQAQGDTMYFYFQVTNAGSDAVTLEDTIKISCYGILEAENGTEYYFTLKIDSTELAVGGIDTFGFYTTQGENWGDSENGTVYTVFPDNSVDTFDFIIFGLDVDGALFTDPDIDSEGIASGNNYVMIDGVFGDPSGIFEVENHTKASLDIFPNPATSTVNVSYSFSATTPAAIRVTDITGRVVLNQDLGRQTPGTQQFSVDVSALNNGIYTIELITDQQRAISKLTISK